MRKTILFFIIFLFSMPAIVVALEGYKEKVKSENLSIYYRNRIQREYSIEDIVNSLVGVSGSVPIGQIRSFINEVNQDRRNKESEINAATTHEEVNRILGDMQ